VAAAAALGLALSACLVAGTAGIDGRVASPPLPLHSRLAVRVCEQAVLDCDRWLYPDAVGRFQARALDPGRYTVTAFLEQPSGLVQLASAETVALDNQTVTVDVVVPVLPGLPPA
jgi:hypothetical protein